MQRFDKRCETLTRKRFLFNGLALGLFGVASMGQAPGAAADSPAGSMTASEKANLALVTAFCESFTTRDMTKIEGFLAADCAYRITEKAPPRTGPAALDQIKNYVAQARHIQFKIFESWASGPVVMNKRIDTFILPERTNAYHLTGVFFVRDGKIAEWTDYMIR